MTTMTAEGRTVWLWPGRATFLGPQLRWDRHATPVDCLAIGADEAFTVHSAEGSWRRRSALVPARVPHRIEAGAGRMLFHYLDPGSARAAGVRGRMTETLGTIAATHLAEQAMLAQVHDPSELSRLALGDTSNCAVDPRIRTAMDAVLAAPEREHDAASCAAAAGLSRSRFLHLFSENAGTSFRRFRVWARLLRAGSAIESGASLTTAATEAGFASASHFSDTFRRMFGLSASALLTSNTQLITMPDHRSREVRQDGGGESERSSMPLTVACSLREVAK